MVKKILWLIVVVACVAQVVSAGLIEDIERLWPDGNSADTPPMIAGPLMEDSLTFVDRDHQYNSIPAYLIGADYIILANDDKDNGRYELRVELAGRATVYMFIDNRTGRYETGCWPDLVPDVMAAGMGWVTSMGFVDTGDNIGIDEHGDGSINAWSSVFVLNGAEGLVTLLQQNDVIYTNWRNMYGVAVTPEPATLALLAMGGLLLSRR